MKNEKKDPYAPISHGKSIIANFNKNGKQGSKEAADKSVARTKAISHAILGAKKYKKGVGAAEYSIVNSINRHVAKLGGYKRSGL